MKENAVYIKAGRNTKVDSKTIHLSDVAKIYSKDIQVAERIKKLVLFQVKSEKKKNYVFSILKVIELIQNSFPEYLICNVGEVDFIVEYSPKEKEHKVWKWIKIGIVCLVTFFGSAFTIMTFNEDASVSEIFDKIYEVTLGEKNTDSYLLEISYAIGLPIGCLVFFNHFANFKLTQDPTPLQIQLRLNEQEINETLVENADREGKSNDVD